MDDRLKHFPHSFQLNIVQECNDGKRKSILDKLERERPTETMCPMEENRNDNFVSYLLFLQGDYTKAVEKNNEVIQRDETNIVALANRVMFTNTNDIYKAEVFMKQLEEIKKTHPDYERMHEVANAELAFCFARMSPQCYPKALEMYKSVNEKYPTEYLWKFGEGLTLKRCATAFPKAPDPGCGVVSDIARCSKLLLEVATKADKPLNAKAWVELGELKRTLNVDGRQCSADYKNVLETLIPSKECYDHALEEAGSDDAFVFERCGVYYQQDVDDLDRSQKLLERAIELRPTVMAHQHLALTLKEKARKWEPDYRPDLKRKQFFYLSSDNPFIQSAIDHLKRSFEMSHGWNTSALESLGFTYLELRDYDNAEDTFRKIIISPDNVTQAFRKVNAYEQVACILFDNSKKDGKSEAQRKELVDECLFFIKKAAETAIQMDIDGTFNKQRFKARRAMNVVTGELAQSDNKDTLEKVAQIFELVGEDEKARVIYEKIRLRSGQDMEGLN